MKVAIYIEDGVTQFVLTPENEFEKATVKVLSEKPLSLKVFHGGFYDCRGGWAKQATPYAHIPPYGDPNDNDLSIIIRITKQEEGHDKASDG